MANTNAILISLPAVKIAGADPYSSDDGSYHQETIHFQGSDVSDVTSDAGMDDEQDADLGEFLWGFFGEDPSHDAELDALCA